jgi:hypothetical protein
MEDPEVYLRAMTAPLASAREGSPFPVTRLSLEAVANAFVVLGLLPAARAEEILAAQRPVLEAAGFLVDREIWELSVNPGARSHQETRAATLDTPERIPRGGWPAIRWLEFSAGSGAPVRLEIPSPAAVPTGTAEPPWPTPAECYLDELAPPDRDWSIGSFETGTVELDTAAIVAAVAGALLAVGALPPDSAVLTGITERVRPDWHLALSERQRALMDPWASPGPASGADLAVRLPLDQATAVIESITAREDMVSVQLYGYPWILEEYWPMIAPCFRVTAVDDTGAEHEGGPDNSSVSAMHEGIGAFWFWPPVGPQARQLRVTVSTLWEAAWALVDIPGR